MLCTVSISGLITPEQHEDFVGKIQNIQSLKTGKSKAGITLYYGFLDGIKFSTGFDDKGNWLNVEGSITKRGLGNNYQNMSLAMIKNTVQELSELFGADLKNFAVRRFDIGVTFSMLEHPETYMGMMLYKPKCTRGEFRKGKVQYQTVLFDNGSMKFQAYDKYGEATEAGEKIPKALGNKLLRVEWEQKNSTYSVLNRPMFLRDFSHPETMEIVLQKFKNHYESVWKEPKKAGAKCYELTRKINALKPSSFE